jgi:hypothetical protein
VTFTFLIGLALLASGPIILRRRYGRQWLLRPVSLLALAAVVYQGLSEAVIRLSGANALVGYRPDSDSIDNGMVVAGLALLTLTVGYVMTHKPVHVDTDVDRADLGRVLDWRILALLTAPLLIATTSGQGYASGEVQNTQGAIDAGGLGYQFFIPMVVLTAFAYLLRHPTRLVLVIGAQTVVLAVAGQRLEILIAAIALAILGLRVGLRPERRQVVTTIALAMLAVIAIGSVRATVGRVIFQSDSGFEARVVALRDGLLNPTLTSADGGNIASEAALRLDSATWTGAVDYALNNSRPLGLRPLQGAVLTSVPSVLYPDKVVDLSELDRSPEAAQIAGLRLQSLDYLPGHLTSFYGALGFWGLMGFSLLVGLALGLVERLALRRAGPISIVALTLLLMSALFYERGIDSYLLFGRSFVVFAVVLGVARFFLGKLEQDARRSSGRRSTPRRLERTRSG